MLKINDCRAPIVVWIYEVAEIESHHPNPVRFSQKLDKHTGLLYIIAMTLEHTSDGRPSVRTRYILRYTRERLYNLRRIHSCQPEPTLLHSLKQLGLPKYRGTRAGKTKFKPRPIPVRITNRNNINIQSHSINGYHHAPRRTPILIEINPTRFTFPSIINTNLRGALIEKKDELSTVLKQNNITVASCNMAHEGNPDSDNKH